MLVDFTNIDFDLYGNVEQPILKLKTLDGRVISYIGNYLNLSPTFRFNDVSEVTFDVPCVNHDGTLTASYDRITGNKLVEIGDFGDFVLISADENGDGIKASKKCKCYSLEYMMNFKKIYIKGSTYCLYDISSGEEDSIMSIVLDKLPGWSIGDFNTSLSGVYRTFDDVEGNIYEFLMNTVQKTFNCLFLFDTKNKKINIIDAASVTEHSPIFISFDNLIKEVDISDLNDEVVTALSGYGADDLSVAEVNPNGTDYIYNLDYFAANGDMNANLAQKWNQYKTAIESYQEPFKSLSLTLNSKSNSLVAAEIKLDDLNIELDGIKDAISREISSFSGIGQTQAYRDLIARRNELTNTLIPNQSALCAQLREDVETASEQLSDIVEMCRFRSFFTDEEYAQISSYIREDSITENSIVKSNAIGVNNLDGKMLQTASEQYPDAIIGASFTAGGNGATIKKVSPDHVFTRQELIDAGIDLSLINQIIQSSTHNIKQETYEISGGSFNLTGRIPNTSSFIQGNIESATFQVNVADIDSSGSDVSKKGYFIFTGILHNATTNIADTNTINVSVCGNITTNGYSVVGSSLTVNVKDGNYQATASASYYQEQAAIQELYDFTSETLRKLSEPSFEFNVSSANYFFSPTFESFKDNTKLGSTVNLAISDDYILKPLVVEIAFNYDDPTSLNLTISNKFKKSSSESVLADILENASATSHSVDVNKYSYNSYKNSGAANEVKDMITGAFDVAKNRIINSTSQGQEWSSAGLYLRKQEGSGFADEQVALINNMIAFTDDNWTSVKTALGEIELPNGNTTWGLAAESVFGQLLAGSNLRITANGAQGEMLFNVDGNGMLVSNGSIRMIGDTTRFLLDPDYGMAFGNQYLYTTSGEGGQYITPSFIDEDGDLIFNDDWYDGIVPENTTFYISPEDGKVYLAGTIYAEDGYFSGAVNATSGNFGALKINGQYITADSDDVLDGGIIRMGSIGASKIDVTDLSAHMASIGSTTSGRFVVNGNSLRAYDSSGSQYFEVTENGIIFGSNSAATDRAITDSIMPVNDSISGARIYQDTAGHRVYVDSDGYYYITETSQGETRVYVPESSLVKDSDGNPVVSYEGGLQQLIDSGLAAVWDSLGLADTRIGNVISQMAGISDKADNSLINQDYADINNNKLSLGKYRNLCSIQITQTEISMSALGRTAAKISSIGGSSGGSCLKVDESIMSTMRMRSTYGIGNLAWVAESDGSLSLKVVT